MEHWIGLMRCLGIKRKMFFVKSQSMSIYDCTNRFADCELVCKVCPKPYAK